MDWSLVLVSQGIESTIEHGEDAQAGACSFPRTMVKTRSRLCGNIASKTVAGPGRKTCLAEDAL